MVLDEYIAHYNQGTRTVYASGLLADAGVDAVFTIGTRPLVSRLLLGAPLTSNT